jgi:hypothetical protein
MMDGMMGGGWMMLGMGVSLRTREMWDGQAHAGYDVTSAVASLSRYHLRPRQHSGMRAAPQPSCGRSVLPRSEGRAVSRGTHRRRA